MELCSPPALRVSMAEIVEAIRRQTGASKALVSYDPDPRLEARVIGSGA